MAEIKTVRPGIGRSIAIDELSLPDLEAVRLLLSGGSVVDWHQLDFHDHSDVDRFLRVNEFEPDSEVEMGWLEDLRSDAVDYLLRVFQAAVPDDVAYHVPARDLFLMASRSSQHRRWACSVLKVMHIIHHLAGREALTRLPIADDVVFRATELKVIQVVEELRAAGQPITEFEWSRKSRDSLINKLLAKRSTLAAKIYDKLRFRLTVDEYYQLMPVLAMLCRQLIPFNYVVPGESVNDLLSFEEEVTSNPALSLHGSALSLHQPRDLQRTHPNEFSGANYRIINFVVDLPLRLDSLLPADQVPPDCCHVVFVLTEFQLADKRTAVQNETGESRHDRYKARQLSQVESRLFGGKLLYDDE